MCNVPFHSDNLLLLMLEVEHVSRVSQFLVTTRSGQFGRLGTPSAH